MKKILAIMLALTLLCLAGCGKKTDAAEEQAAAADAQATPTEEVAAEPEVEVKSVTISNEEGDAEMKIEYQALDGLTYEEYDNYGTPCIRFEYEPENISMTLSMTVSKETGTVNRSRTETSRDLWSFLPGRLRSNWSLDRRRTRSVISRTWISADWIRIRQTARMNCADSWRTTQSRLSSAVLSWRADSV